MEHLLTILSRLSQGTISKASDYRDLDRVKQHANALIGMLNHPKMPDGARSAVVESDIEREFLNSLKTTVPADQMPVPWRQYLERCPAVDGIDPGGGNGQDHALSGVGTFDHQCAFQNLVCPNAFLYLELRGNGDLSPCCYLPFAFGNIHRQTLEEIWQSAAARELRRSMRDGSFRYCDARKCAGMQKSRLLDSGCAAPYQVPYELFRQGDPALPADPGQVPRIISFDDDPTCNLTCPSCRTGPQSVDRRQSDQIYANARRLLNSVPLGIEQLWFSGAGDPLASRAYRRLFQSGELDQYSDLKIRLDTNGMLLTRNNFQGVLGGIRKKIYLIAVSVDAADAGTYAAIRRGGDFHRLMENLAFLGELKKETSIQLILRMIVQDGNFRQMGDFVDLAKHVGADRAVFSGIANWGTFDDQAFQHICVHRQESPGHQAFLQSLGDPRLADPMVDMGNLTRLHAQSQCQANPDPAGGQPILDADPLLPAGKRALAVAFYLPQFHPIPENDGWWGKGFTEWANVAKAKPLFEGHRQPLLPADLGFYDLRVAETREQQAELARQYGLDAFCYWHYWFAGKRLIERPFEEVVRSGKPDFPFCLGWANQTWSGIWHGAPDRILIEQTYPGGDDHRAHFAALLPAFRDPRYFRVGGKPLFVIYAPQNLPDARAFTSLWQELAAGAGLGGFHFVAHSVRDARAYGCQGCVDNAPFVDMNARDLAEAPGEKRRQPTRHRYEDLIQYLRRYRLGPDEYPLVVPNWDNTPRSGVNGLVLQGSTPELFQTMLKDAVRKAEANPDPERRIVFIKAWNEWAEGNHLEPDVVNGHGYLQVLRETLFEGAADSSLKN